MNFFKKLKSRLLGSVKEDLNSALGGARNDFNAKIESAVMDLIALKTGIRVSNIPEKISELALQNATNRQTIEKFLTKISYLHQMVTQQKDTFLIPNRQ